MRCDFAPDPADPTRVRCNACGRPMIRKPLPMAEHVALDCTGAGPRRPRPKAPEHVDDGFGPSDGRAEVRCVHRGEQLRRVPCKVGCASSRGVMLPVYACAKLGECTSTKVEPSKPTSLPICTGCDLRKDPTDDRPPESTSGLAQWGFY